MLDKTGPLALDKDCLYRLGHLVRRVALPLKVKLMCGPLPPGLPKDFPGKKPKKTIFLLLNIIFFRYFYLGEKISRASFGDMYPTTLQ